MLDWVLRGYRFRFAAPAHAPDDRRGTAAARVQAFRCLIGSRMTPEKVDEAVRSSEPPRMRLPNHASVEEHACFVEGELLECLQTGAASIVRESDAHCVLGMGIVKNRRGKLRLVLDARALNLWQTYLPFSFERLSDLPQYIELDDLLVVLDAKSGYHHIGAAPEHRCYLCVRFKGVVIRYNVLPFGVAQACFAYTKIMRQVYGPLRARGWRFTHYLDDFLLAQQPLGRALYDVLTMAMLFKALGWFLSVPKCRVWPQTAACFLGLQVDTHGRQFSIPVDKQQYITGVLRGLLAAGGASRRQYAQVAGLLAAVAPAVPMSRVYLSGLYEVLRGISSWDEVFPFPAHARRELQWWLDHLPEFHGRRWHRSTNVLEVVGDVSEVGFAGYTPGGLIEGRIGRGFLQAEMAQLAAGVWSSTVRETLNAEVCIRAVCEALGAAAGGCCIRYIGDNQGSIAALERQTGCAAVFAIVKRLHIYCYSLGVDLEFQWRPREDAQVAHADALSRFVDWSAVYLHKKTYKRVCEAMGCYPNLDVFAGGGKGEHQTSQYFTVCACPGTAGVDAFAQNWRITPCQPHAPALVWAFPPEWYVAACINKIAEDGIECLLVVPVGMQFWRPLLHRLPVRRKLRLAYRPGVYWLGSQAPPEWRAKQRKFSFDVYRVSFV